MQQVRAVSAQPQRPTSTPRVLPQVFSKLVEGRMPSLQEIIGPLETRARAQRGELGGGAERGRRPALDARQAGLAQEDMDLAY
jgi:hypothetical protein